MKSYTVTMYGPEDYEALDGMSKKEVAELLDRLEGCWMPHRPSAYCSGAEMDESDYMLLKYCKALDLAVKWLQESE